MSSTGETYVRTVCEPILLSTGEETSQPGRVEGSLVQNNLKMNDDPVHPDPMEMRRGVGEGLMHYSDQADQRPTSIRSLSLHNANKSSLD